MTARSDPKVLEVRLTKGHNALLLPLERGETPKIETELGYDEILSGWERILAEYKAAHPDHDEPPTYDDCA